MSVNALLTVKTIITKCSILDVAAVLQPPQVKLKLLTVFTTSTKVDV